MICGDACVCIKRCDLWKRRVVNKHHQQSCCGQKRVCTYVVGGRVGMNDTCYFTLDMKQLDIPTPPHPTHKLQKNSLRATAGKGSWSNYIFPQTCLSCLINKATLFFQMAACLDPFYEIVRPLSTPHHPYQTPSLCPFRADAVVLQIQVLQSRVLSEAFGQGLTGES